MPNRIKDMSVFIVRLDAVEAEIQIKVSPEFISDRTEARGRVVGPRCTRASTIEIAYPLREQSRRLEPGPEIVLRAIIPEPCLWDEESPFLYQCVVELREQGQRCDERSLDYGLTYAGRHS